MNREPLILNLETATGVCSVGISKGVQTVAFKEAKGLYEHSRILTSLINNCLKENDLALAEIDAVAVSSGPGSYTSLRVGISTAKGICYALNKPMIGVDTLHSLALAAQQEKQDPGALYCPMIDARRMEVYCSIYTGDNKLVTEPAAKIIQENTFDEFFASGKRIIFCGNGAEKCSEILTSPKAEFYPLACSPRFLPALSASHFKQQKFVDLAYFTPCYLKPPNITIPKNMKL